MTPEKSRIRYAWGATIATLAVVIYVIIPKHGARHHGQPASAPSAPADVVTIAGPGELAIADGSALEHKLGLVKVENENVTYPKLVVSGNILARRGTARGKDAWQFASGAIASAYADYLKADAEAELAQRQRNNVQDLTTLQTKRAEEVKARVQRLVETGTEATRSLVTAEAEAAQTRLEGERAVFEATSNLAAATRSREAAQQQLVQAGLQPEVLAAAHEGAAILGGDVPEARMDVVKEGEQCNARFYGMPDNTFQGVVTRVAPVVSPERRTLGVLVALDDPDDKLKPGMFGEVGLGTSARSALLVPADSVVHIGETDYVLVRRDNGRLKVTPVHVGEPHEGRIEIVEGLTPGVEVVGSGAVLLKRHAIAALTGTAIP